MLSIFKMNMGVLSHNLQLIYEDEMLNQGWQLTPVISALQRLRQKNCREFKDSLD